MILYNPSHVINFYTFGIQIPSAADRMKQIFTSLDTIYPCSAYNWLIREIPELITFDDLSLIHTDEYLHSLFYDDTHSGLYTAYELINSDGSFNRYNPDTAQRPLETIKQDIIYTVSGTYYTLLTALKNHFAFFLGGGMHHAHHDFGHGFCPVNDIAIAVKKSISAGLISSAWIIDTDVHRGDGTADIFSEESAVQTLSIHMTHGWPLDASEYDVEGNFNRAFTPGSIDIGIDRGEEKQYNNRLHSALKTLATAGLPDIAIVVAGADPYIKDELPSSQGIQLSQKQMLERDMLVYSFLESHSIPSAWLAAGGYGSHVWEVQSGFLAHMIRERYCYRP